MASSLGAMNVERLAGIDAFLDPCNAHAQYILIFMLNIDGIFLVVGLFSQTTHKVNTLFEEIPQIVLLHCWFFEKLFD